METIMTMRRNIKRDARRIEQIKRDRIGRFKKSECISLREAIRWITIKLQWAFALVSIAAIAFILITPPKMINPLLSIETVKVAEAKENNSNSIQAEVEEDTLDRRIENCWAKGWTPGVLERGFVCAAPAVELDQK